MTQIASQALSYADVLFYILAGFILTCAAFVAFSKNIIHSAFALLGVFAGVAGMYGLIVANFIMAVQLLVYVGGVLVIILFAIMLTRGIQDVRQSNPSTGLVTASLIGLAVAVMLITVAIGFPWKTTAVGETSSSIPLIGNALLDKYLIPFEVLSVLLLAALIGAVMLVRKEIKNETTSKEHE
jgi:NAD(P)H-quinone oxidoreductase subunit 6